MSLRALSVAVVGLSLVGFVGCGEDSGNAGGSNGSGGGSATGAGGAGGAVAGGPSSKPVCQGEPSGSETPLARADTAAAMAPDGLSMVMYGGDTATVVCGSVPAREHVGDTWILDLACGGWTEVMGAGPGERARHAMAADPTRNRALLFGGRTRAGSSGPYTLFNDVWAFDFTAKAWTEIETSGAAPAARHNPTVEVVGDKLYVFGGSSSTSGTAFAPENDLFVLDLTTNAWSEIGMGATKPEARLFHSMASDAASGKLFVVSGGDAQAFTGPFLKDAWSYDIASDTWTDLGASFAEVDDPGRIKPGLLAQPVEGGTALHFFGGHDDGNVGNRNDVSILDPAAASWRAASPGDTFNKAPAGTCNFAPDFTVIDEASPERRSGFSFAARPDGQAFVVFGGDTDCGRASDAWWYDAVNGVWEIVRATPVGLSCLRFSDTCSGLCG